MPRGCSATGGGIRPRRYTLRPPVGRVLLLSWEYPPIVEGGLGRHMRKLSEALAARGEEVHVLARGRAGDPPRELRSGVHVHRVPAAPTPRELDGVPGLGGRAQRAAGRSG